MKKNNEEETILDRISRERKDGIAKGEIPDFFVTPGYQLFLDKYQYKGQTVKQTYQRISKTAAKHLPVKMQKEYEEKFFNLMWKGHLACSTPVLANMGTNRGCPVSCSGGYIADSIYDFYEAQKEAAMLSKNGFGTSGYLGDIRSRGTQISGGGKASGILPVLKDFVQMSRDVSQGGVRRGSWAGYIPIDHPDFYEVVNHLAANPDDLNIGWNVSDNFIARLDAGDEDAIARYQRAMKVKCVTGKGYFVFIDRANRQNPPMYKDHNLSVKGSNLCSEIFLHSDNDHSFTCVLSSMNAAKYDEWKDTDAVYIATIFLDCVAQEFIELGKNIKGLENTVRFTEKSRALGLGLLGFHTYLQQEMIPFEDLRAHMKNAEIFQHLDKESLRASQDLVKIHGFEPEWCKGYGVFNTHRIAVAPNTSSALLCGGVSQGIEPVVENVYNQTGAAGEMARINPTLLKLMKERGVYSKKTLTHIVEDLKGSVQEVDWLSDDEKAVFKTAFEINQKTIIHMASSRQRWIDQGQSLNLFFDADESEEYISEVHKLAFKDERLKALYYMRSKAGIQAAKSECVACEG